MEFSINCTSHMIHPPMTIVYKLRFELSITTKGKEKLHELKNVKAAVVTLGCKVNQYESDAMFDMLTDAGAEIVSPKEGADIYIVNTCSVTNIAERKSRQMLHRAKKLNPDTVVAAVGCYARWEKKN